MIVYVQVRLCVRASRGLLLGRAVVDAPLSSLDEIDYPAAPDDRLALHSLTPHARRPRTHVVAGSFARGRVCAIWCCLRRLSVCPSPPALQRLCTARPQRPAPACEEACPPTVDTLSAPNCAASYLDSPPTAIAGPRRRCTDPARCTQPTAHRPPPRSALQRCRPCAAPFCGCTSACTARTP